MSVSKRAILLLSLIALALIIPKQLNANIIALNTVSADATVAGIDGNFTTVKNVINGQISGANGTGAAINILGSSVDEPDMASAANPRVRDSEILGITTDSATSQATFVYTGLTPATSSNLTSNISTGTAYINGYRVNKTATSQTYTASRDTYVDLSQGGAFTLTAVSNGASAPAVAANSARLAKVVTSATAISSVTDLARRTVPGLVVATNYRDGFFVSRDSTTTITVLPGNIEINGASITKTATTTLNIGTAGDWAGGSSLRAADTFGFVGVDSSGNLKLHTTAPNFDNYARTTSAGKLRYVSWSSTTYRVLGWFYMDGASSALVQVASNIKEGSVPNIVISQDPSTTGVVTTTATIPVAPGLDIMNQKFYASGGPVFLSFNASGNGADSVNDLVVNLSQDASGTNLYAERSIRDSSGTNGAQIATQYLYTPPQATRTYRVNMRASAAAGTRTINGRVFIVEES